MKKIVCLLALLCFGLNCNATEIFSVTSPQSVQVDGTVKCRGNSDYIILNSKSFSDMWNDNFNGYNRTIVRQIANALRDPYLVQIDGKSYIMVKDNPSKKWSSKDLLGINDTKNTLFVGDQIFTDIIGANLAGIRSILVAPIDPHEEIQIVLKRFIEKPVIACYKRHLKKVNK